MHTGCLTHACASHNVQTKKSTSARAHEPDDDADRARAAASHRPTPSLSIYSGASMPPMDVSPPARGRRCRPSCTPPPWRRRARARQLRVALHRYAPPSSPDSGSIMASSAIAAPPSRPPSRHHRRVQPAGVPVRRPVASRMDGAAIRPIARPACTRQGSDVCGRLPATSVSMMLKSLRTCASYFPDEAMSRA